VRKLYKIALYMHGPAKYCRWCDIILLLPVRVRHVENARTCMLLALLYRPPRRIKFKAICQRSFTSAAVKSVFFFRKLQTESRYNDVVTCFRRSSYSVTMSRNYPSHSADRVQSNMCIIDIYFSRKGYDYMSTSLDVRTAWWCPKFNK